MGGAKAGVSQNSFLPRRLCETIGRWLITNNAGKDRRDQFWIILVSVAKSQSMLAQQSCQYYSTVK
jgi:hypothetical protein